MEKKIISLLTKIVKAKGMKVTEVDDCVFKAEKGWRDNKEVIDIYYYRYTDETYDVILKILVDENADVQNMKIKKIEEDTISEERLIELLNELK